MQHLDDPLLREILDRAAELPPERRGAYLDEACGDDQQLRTTVTELLDSLDRATHFLVDPTIDPTSVGDGEHDAAPVDAPPVRVGARVGNYLLVEEIGEGGMGAVFRARQEHPVRRDVALKVIKLGMDTRRVIHRFQAERQALAKMDHPNIARVFEAGATESGRPFFVMEMVDGVPVTDYCDGHRLDVCERLELFVQVCNAVQHAHQKGIIHRDLKPTNILVARHDDRPVPKIIDFGIAKATDDQSDGATELTDVAQFVGTPLYMSPEQAAPGGADVDTRSDVYALGVLLYELLAGTTPFDRARLKALPRDEVRRVIREEPPPRPSTRLTGAGGDAAAADVAARRGTDPRRLRLAIRGDLDWIVLKCIDKDPGRRYESASTLASDVRRYLADEPVEASPPSAGYRARKFVHRHRTAFGTAAALAVVLVGATIASSLWAVQARRARARADLLSFVAQASADDAGRKAELAERQFRRADALGQVIRAILPASRPTANSVSRDSGMVELLDHAANQAGELFQSDPQQEIDIRLAVADMLRGLGATAEADNHLREAYKRSESMDKGRVSEQTLRLATQLFSPGDKEFAERTYEMARARLGEDHEVTLHAKRGWVNALNVRTAGGFYRPEEGKLAEEMSSQMAARFDGSAPAKMPITTYQAMQQRAVLLNGGLRYAEAANVAGRALDAARKDGRVPPVIRGALGFSLTEALVGLGRLDEAVIVARDAYEFERATLGDFHRNTERMFRAYVRTLGRVGNHREADRLLDETLRLARALRPDDEELILDQMTQLAEFKVDTGRAAEGLPVLLDVIRLTARGKGQRDVERLRMLSREALLIGLGAKSQPSDGTLRAQVYFALEDVWRDNPQIMPGPEQITPKDVRYSLYPWNDQGKALVSDATLEDRPAEPAPGLYLLSMEVAPRGAKPFRQAMGILVAPWDLSFYPTEKVGESGGNPRSVGRFTMPGVAISEVLNHAPTVSSPSSSVSGRATVTLPAGRYRFVTTSCDGIHLEVDGGRVISAWSKHRPRRDRREVELEGGPHEITFGFFQSGRRGRLWVRIEPVSQDADRVWAAHGGHPLRTFQRALDEQGQSGGADALAVAAQLYAHAGRYDDAIKGLDTAIDMDKTDVVWPELRALLSFAAGRSGDYTAWRTRLLDRTGKGVTDRATAARTAAVALVGVADAKDARVARWLAAADPEGAADSERAACQLARGIGAYRAGRFPFCGPVLAAALAGRLTPEARATAQLFTAMTLYRQSRPAEASEAMRAAEARIAALPGVDQEELDVTRVEDRLVCLLARREAESLLGYSSAAKDPPGPSATRAATPR